LEKLRSSEPVAVLELVPELAPALAPELEHVVVPSNASKRIVVVPFEGHVYAMLMLMNFGHVMVEPTQTQVMLHTREVEASLLNFLNQFDPVK
jgi:hypothetical protein